MKAATPHYLLFSESCRQREQGQWRFVLQSIDGLKQFEAGDDEPDVQGERLELLAVVRGLEALEQPSRVTLVTPSKYVNRGLTYGLDEWRANDWQWEHYGEMVPVKNRDLWQRVDRALSYHELECRTWRFDLPHGAVDGRRPKAPSAHTVGLRGSAAGRAGGAVAACKRLLDAGMRTLGLRMGRRGARLLPLMRFE
ncbi:MAG: RNase H family protein [Candidatus Deferrimicrobiaceae bacterium]